MKNLVILLALLAISCVSNAQSSKTIAETYNVSDMDLNVLYTPSFIEVEYKEIQANRIIVETNISSNCKLTTLEFIIESGLASPILTTNEKGEGFISFPSFDKLQSVFIKGVQLETKLKITVYMPKSIGMLATK